MTATPAAEVLHPGPLPPSALQPFANARLLLFIHQLPGRFDSPRIGRMACEAFLKRGRMVGESSSGLGIDSGDFSYGGYLCRSALLDPLPSTPGTGSLLSWPGVKPATARRWLMAASARPRPRAPSGWGR